MRLISLLLLLTFLIVFYFAYTRELKEQANSYKNSTKDSNKTIELKVAELKVISCLEVDLKTIKWRRCFMISLISIMVFFLVLYGRIPEFKELLLGVIIVYIITYMEWQNYAIMVSKESAKTGIKNLKLLRKIIKNKEKVNILY